MRPPCLEPSFCPFPCPSLGSAWVKRLASTVLECSCRFRFATLFFAFFKSSLALQHNRCVAQRHLVASRNRLSHNVARKRAASGNGLSAAITLAGWIVSAALAMFLARFATLLRPWLARLPAIAPQQHLPALDNVGETPPPSRPNGTPHAPPTARLTPRQRYASRLASVPARLASGSARARITRTVRVRAIRYSAPTGSAQQWDRYRIATGWVGRKRMADRRADREGQEAYREGATVPRGCV
jgi:hypothetical protein